MSSYRRRFSAIQAVPDWIQCIATFSNQGRILWRRELAITTANNFSEDLNYLLYIDDSGRMLQWPTSDTISEGRSSRYTPKPGDGRPVQPLTVKSWQVPQHPGPMTVAQAIVFAELAKPDMLNSAQWEAVAEWICMGGTVFVQEESTAVIDQLRSAAPLPVQPAGIFEQLSVYRCGCGSLQVYSGPLFSTADGTTPRLIAESTARLSRHNLLSVLDETNLFWWDGRNADRTRMLVVAVFSIYTLLSGVVTLVLFRLNRRWIATYTGVVVLAACVASIVLGGVLRTTSGDMRWLSVTQAGPGGLVQLAKIDVQSAGGRSTQTAVRGSHPDLQLLESEVVDAGYYRYYVQDSSRTHYPPFSFQPSLVPDDPKLYQIDVPITPWGFRRAYAADFAPAARRLAVELTYQSPDSSLQLLPRRGALPGQFTIIVTNHLPFDLTRCLLAIGSTDVHLEISAATQVYDSATRSFRMREGTVAGGFSQYTSYVEIPDLPASKTIVATQLAISLIHDNNVPVWGTDVPKLVPRVPYPGATSAWIVATISRSPILSIEEQRSDFEPSREMHLFVQEIPPEEMPVEWLNLHQQNLDRQIAAAAAAAEIELKSDVQQ